MTDQKEVVAVLDVGKTNKKIVLFDREFKIVAEERVAIPVFMQDGLEMEDADALIDWTKKTLIRLGKDHNIVAMSVTTHGIAFALLDDSGNRVYPVISYTSEKGLETQDAFYEEFGNEPSLHQATSTADFGFINAGKVLFYLKTRHPDIWAKAKSALFYPQYLSYTLTGKMAIEPTFVGNHSYLWDFRTLDWSSVAKRMGADRLFPSQMSQSWERLGMVRQEIATPMNRESSLPVTVGIHDSNASLLPYYAQGYENFTLNSTGTWCVGMRPAKSPQLTEEEIQTKTFYNQDVFKRPVKTSIFMGGQEYESYLKIADLEPGVDAGSLKKVVEEAKLFVTPGMVKGGCIVPGCKPGIHECGQFTPFESLNKDMVLSLGEAYRSALVLSLALQTRIALQRLECKSGETVFIEGGFAKNREYCELVAALCPHLKIALTDLVEATAFGTALTAWMMKEKKELADFKDDFSIQPTFIPAGSFPGLNSYADKFEELCKK